MANVDGYALEHRWLMYEMAIPVPPNPHDVHHLNGDKADNRWSNLEVVEAGEHHRRHAIAAGVVTNQFGTFPVIADPEARRHHKTLAMRRYRAERKAR